MTEAGGRGSVAQGWSPWPEGQSLAAWREVDDRTNSDFHVLLVAQGVPAPVSSVAFPSVVHAQLQVKAPKTCECLLGSSRAGEACLWPRGWVIMPLSGPCPERVQLIPLLWKSYPRETGNKCRHLTGHRPIGKWRQIGREELDLESGLRCSGHLPPWVLSIS